MKPVLNPEEVILGVCVYGSDRVVSIIKGFSISSSERSMVSSFSSRST
jgi:hypothetical protein